MKRYSISRRLVTIFTIIAVMAALLVPFAGIVNEYAVADRLVQDQTRAIETSTLPVLAHLVWTVNDHQADQILRGLVAQPSIAAAVLTTDGIRTVRFGERTASSEQYQLKTWPVVYPRDDTIYQLGELRVWTRNPWSMAWSMEPIGQGLLGGLIAVGIISIGIAAMIRRTVTAPLVRLASDVRGLTGEEAPTADWIAALERDHGEETYQVRHALHDAISARRETEQRLASSLREKEVLLQEVHHRVKNNLQVISSMLSLQRDTVSDAGARQALEDSGQRVLSMALVHELLYQGSSADTVHIDEYLYNLTAAIPPPAGGGITISVDAPAIPVTIDAAIPTGLIVTELITNAVKHAFVGGAHGVIAVIATAEEDGALRIAVVDNGIGLPQGWSVDVTDSLGMRIITALVSQLHTSLTVGDKNGPPPGTASPADVTNNGGAHEASGIGPGTRFSFIIPTAENPTSGGARAGEFASHRSDSPLRASRAEAEGAPKLRSLK